MMILPHFSATRSMSAVFANASRSVAMMVEVSWPSIAAATAFISSASLQITTREKGPNTSSFNEGFSRNAAAITEAMMGLGADKFEASNKVDTVDTAGCLQ